MSFFSPLEDSNLEKVEQIEWRTWSLLKDVFVTTIYVPIQLHRIAKDLGLTVFEGDIRNRNISGIYWKDKREICVQKGEPQARKAFTVAHEMGHFLLHEHKSKEVFYRTDEEKPLSPEEEEANQFAASLLMPRVIIKGTIRGNSIADYFQIADLFGVSPVAAKSRLDFLGIQVT